MIDFTFITDWLLMFTMAYLFLQNPPVTRHIDPQPITADRRGQNVPLNDGIIRFTRIE